MAINSDGLFGKANEVADKWNESVEKEETAISDLLTELDKVSPMEVEISTELPTGWDTNKVSAVAVGLSGKAPIPAGYVVSKVPEEDTIAGGLVIYKKENGITDVTSQNHDTALEQCDQFVWIPVADINSMVMCKSNGKAIKLDGTATEGGKTVCSLVQGSDGTLTCTTHNSTDLAGRLYSTYTDESDSNGIYTRKLDFSNTAQTYNADSGLREPANLKHETYGDAGDTGTSTIIEILEAEEDATYDEIKEDWLQLQQDYFDAMAESVAKYGGFYISRYEVGVGGISKKNKDVLANSSEDNNWWGMYSTLITAEKPMIWGSQYDQVIKFIGEQAQVGHNDRNLDKTSPSKSGLNDLDLMNNIYDLEGNLYEWTAEADSTNVRVYRGVVYYYAGNGNFYPASSRFGNYPTSTSSYYTTRISLYL